MGYNFSVKGYHRVKATKNYPWPWSGDPDRTLVIFDDDVLQKVSPGVYNKVTGIGTLNHQIPDEDVVFVEDECHLRMTSLSEL